MSKLELKNIANKFNNTKLKKIINTYQLSLKNGTVTGLGDYLRGCFSLYQVAKILNLEFDMDMKNHPMSKFIISTDNSEKHIEYNEVCRFYNDNYVGVDSKTYKKRSPQFLDELIKLLNSVDDVEHRLFSNSFPIFDNIRNESRNFIRSKLVPNEMMKENIRLRMSRLGLKRKCYSVIHLRCGDSFLLDNHTDKNGISIFEKVSEFLSKNLNPGSKFLLLSDNNAIKIMLKKRLPQLIVQVREITHLGEKKNLDDVQVMNTLLDFYTMANSNKIISFSKFNWGSGFSQWCSVIYNIPYVKFVV